MIVNLDVQAAFGVALATSLNRAQGARAANEAEWLQRQLHAAALCAGQLSRLEAQLASIVSVPVSGPSMAVAQIQAMQARVKQQGLALELKSLLDFLKIAPDVRQQAIQAMVSADPVQAATLGTARLSSLVGQAAPSSLHVVAGADLRTFADAPVETVGAIPRGWKGDVVDIKAGVLRQARARLHLSLAQVGGDELTREAVRLIETSKVRPSMRSLRVIADRLGIPIDAVLLGPPGSWDELDELMEEFDREAHDLSRVVDALARARAMICELARAREQAGMTQAQVARRIGTKSPQLRVWSVLRWILGCRRSSSMRPSSAAASASASLFALRRTAARPPYGLLRLHPCQLAP